MPIQQLLEESEKSLKVFISQERKLAVEEERKRLLEVFRTLPPDERDWEEYLQDIINNHAE